MNCLSYEMKALKGLLKEKGIKVPESKSEYYELSVRLGCNKELDDLYKQEIGEGGHSKNLDLILKIFKVKDKNDLKAGKAVINEIDKSVPRSEIAELIGKKIDGRFIVKSDLVNLELIGYEPKAK